MPFPNIELPADFDLPRINEKPRHRGRDNLRHLGRPKGALDKISRDLKSGIIDAAIAHGRDGAGSDGLQGYLYLLASENRKTFAGLLARILPYNVSATASTQSISEVRILSIPAGSHYSAAQLREIEQGHGTIEALTPLERHDAPVLEPIETEAPAIEAQTERDAGALAQLAEMTATVKQLAARVGVSLDDD